MTYEIEPYQGVGPIRLGMTVEQVRAALASEVRPARPRGSSMPPDRFPALGITVGYSHARLCEFIDFTGPAVPTLHGQALLGPSYREVRHFVELHDPAVHVGGAGLHSDALGIALYKDGADKEPEEPVESVSLFAKGYYEQYGSG